MEMSQEAHDDPWAVLGVSSQAGDDEIRAAYLRGVKKHPPDRSPEQFERIRDAYDALRNPKGRMLRMLESVDAQAPLVSLLGSKPAERRFTGPKPWQAVIEEK